MRGGSLQLAGGGDPVVAPPQPRRTFKPVAVLPSAHCPLKTVSDEACLPSAGAGPYTPTYPGPKEGRSQVGWGSSRSSLSRRSHPGGCQLWVPAAGSSLSPVVASQGPSAGLSPSWPPIALPCPHPPQGGVHPEPSFRLPGARSQGSAQPLPGLGPSLWAGPSQDPPATPAMAPVRTGDPPRPLLGPSSSHAPLWCQSLDLIQPLPAARHPTPLPAPQRPHTPPSRPRPSAWPRLEALPGPRLQAHLEPALRLPHPRARTQHRCPRLPGPRLRAHPSPWRWLGSSD